MPASLSNEEQLAKELFVALIQNPERYNYISKKVEEGMSNDDATQKNIDKAFMMSEQFFKTLKRRRVE